MNTRTKKHIQQTRLAGKIRKVLIAYATSQLILSVTVTFLTWAGLAFLGVRHAAILSVLTGSLSVIPMAGMLISAGVAALVAIFDGARFLPQAPVLMEGVAVVIMYALMNLLVDYALAPLLTARMVRIHPALLLAAVFMGMAVFGIPGAILAVPVVLVGKTLWEEKKGKNPAT